jgi:hypothetical protein
MRLKKRIESIYSSVDLGLNSILTFITFIFIKNYFGIDLVGYFGILLSIGAIGETFQQGLYENPLFLNLGVGIQKFRLNIFSLGFIVIIPLLVVDRFLIADYLFSGFLYSISHILIHNIRIFDYKKNIINSATYRSIIIAVLQIIFFAFMVSSKNTQNLNYLLYGISTIRIFFILLNKKKIFAYKDMTNNEKNTYFLISSLLTIIRSRLPLWLLLPFGLGLVGIYETFRTILEIYLTPSRPVILVLLKNLKKDGPKNILKFGTICGILSSVGVGISYYQILNFEIYSIPELKSFFPYIALIIITFCFWISEVTGIIFQSNGYIKFDSFRRFLSVLMFSLTGLLSYRFLNLNLFLFLVSLIYLVEVFISIAYRPKLNL